MSVYSETYHLKDTETESIVSLFYLGSQVAKSCASKLLDYNVVK
jgi:hypothetical protein